MTAMMSSLVSVAGPGELGAADAAVELHPADRRQVVALRGEEEAVEQRLDRILGRRLAGTHHPVDRHAGGGLVGRVVGAQRLRDVRALVEVVRVDRLDRRHARFLQLQQELFGDLVVGLGQHFAGGLVDDVGGERAADDVVVRHGELLDAALRPARGCACAVIRLSRGTMTLWSLPSTSKRAISPAGARARTRAAAPFGRQVERVEHEELLEDVLVGEADRLQQRRHRHLAPAVDAEEQEILRVELEVEPRAAVGNHAGREQELAGAVRLAAVVLEEHAGRAVELRDDDALGAVDHERAVVRHERNLAHVDLLLLHFLDRVLRRFLVHQDEPHLRAQRRAIGEAALLAFGDVERRRQQREAHVLEPGVARVARDREDRRERGLQAFVLARVGRGVRLQERPVGRKLRFEQERHLEHARPLGEALADALLLGKRIRLHGRHFSRHSILRLTERLVGSIALPGVVVGLYQPLADDGARITLMMQAPSDHACPLQSLQKTKRRGLSPIRSSSPSRRLGLVHQFSTLAVVRRRASPRASYQAPAGLCPRATPNMPIPSASCTTSHCRAASAQGSAGA